MCKGKTAYIQPMYFPWYFAEGTKTPKNSGHSLASNRTVLPVNLIFLEQYMLCHHRCLHISLVYIHLCSANLTPIWCLADINLWTGLARYGINNICLLSWWLSVLWGVLVDSSMAWDTPWCQLLTNTIHIHHNYWHWRSNGCAKHLVCDTLELQGRLLRRRESTRQQFYNPPLFGVSFCPY